MRPEGPTVLNRKMRDVSDTANTKRNQGWNMIVVCQESQKSAQWATAPTLKKNGEIGPALLQCCFLFIKRQWKQK